MHEQLTTEEEISALWAEIAATRPDLTVDAALTEASLTVADLLMFAAAWDVMTAAYQNTRAGATAPHKPAHAA